VFRVGVELTNRDGQAFAGTMPIRRAILPTTSIAWLSTTCAG
jgi:hypothetical protein